MQLEELSNNINSYHLINYLLGFFMSGKVYFYKGINKVKVITESEGYWIVEAVEDFIDYVNGKQVSIKIGDRRIVPITSLSSKMVLIPPIDEHAYERKMETKLKRIIADEEKKTGNKRKSK